MTCSDVINDVLLGAKNNKNCFIDTEDGSRKMTIYTPQNIYFLRASESDSAILYEQTLGRTLDQRRSSVAGLRLVSSSPCSHRCLSERKTCASALVWISRLLYAPTPQQRTWLKNKKREQ